MMEKNEKKKKDGFVDEQYFIIPTESFGNYAGHPLIKGMYLTDFSRGRATTTEKGRRGHRNIF